MGAQRWEEHEEVMSIEMGGVYIGEEHSDGIHGNIERRCIEMEGVWRGEEHSVVYFSNFYILSIHI